MRLIIFSLAILTSGQNFAATLECSDFSGRWRQDCNGSGFDWEYIQDGCTSLTVRWLGAKGEDHDFEDKFPLSLLETDLSGQKHVFGVMKQTSFEGRHFSNVMYDLHSDGEGFTHTYSLTRVRSGERSTATGFRNVRMNEGGDSLSVVKFYTSYSGPADSGSDPRKYSSDNMECIWTRIP